MFKLIYTIIRLTLFAAVVLALGNIIYWKNRTISDQIRVGMAHAQSSDWYDGITSWTKNLTQDLKRGFSIQNQQSSLKKPLIENEDDPEDDIPSTERAKLRALIQELNGKKN